MHNHPELRILVLDNDDDMCSAQCKIIANCGHQTWSASTSSEALTAIKTYRIDAIFCDVDIPGDNLSPSEIIFDLRRNWPTVKIIVMSSMLDYNMKMRLKRLGADAWLRKPLTEVQVDCTVEKLYPDNYNYDLVA